MRMTEEELLQLLKAHGWNLIRRRRRQREYLYAQKWVKGEKYLTSQANLPATTPEQILSKLGIPSG